MPVRPTLESVCRNENEGRWLIDLYFLMNGKKWTQFCTVVNKLSKFLSDAYCKCLEVKGRGHIHPIFHCQTFLAIETSYFFMLLEILLNLWWVCESVCCLNIATCHPRTKSTPPTHNDYIFTFTCSFTLCKLTHFLYLKVGWKIKKKIIVSEGILAIVMV